MAKKKVIEDLQSADKQHSQRTERYIRQVDILYRKAVEEITKLAGRVKGLKEGETFSFDKTTSADKDVEQCLKNLCSQIKAVVEKGEKGEWHGACDKNDKFIASVLSTSKLKKSTLQRYQNRNLEALSAFQIRKVDGLGLSDRIWKYVKNTKNEIELAIDTSKIEISLGSGTSAAALSRDVRSCLVHPDKLFRRVRDKYGNLQLSKAASLYHPGQGVYRSSYKNAMRLARTEINMAYRQSDYLRWQQLDFVVGIQVETSNNHTAEDADGKGRHQIVDICDALAGKYPKDFKFVGWHPQCKCHATPILKSLDEIEQEVDEDGDYINLPSASAVNDVPLGFKDYVRDNEERMKGWSSIPYYIKDNPQYVDKALNPEKYLGKALCLDINQQKTLSQMEMYSITHEDNKVFANVLKNVKKAALDGNHDAFDAETRILRALYEQNPDGSIDKEKKKKGVSRLSSAAKHIIYEKDIKDQFVEIYESKNGKKIYLHVLKYRDEGDFDRLIKAAKLYANEEDVFILPEIHQSEKGIRERLGIGTETRVPDLKLKNYFVDVKSPSQWSNIIRNANSASGQGAIACITDDFFNLNEDKLAYIANSILSDKKNYKKAEVHFISKGVIYKYNDQSISFGQGSAPSRGAHNAFISRGTKVSKNSNQSTINEQLLTEEREKRRILTLERAKIDMRREQKKKLTIYKTDGITIDLR